MRTSLELCRARNWFTTKRTFCVNPNPNPNPYLTTTMENPAAEGDSQSSAWFHYQHHDGLDSLRWDARECHEFLDERPWQGVLKFYSLVAAGKLSLFDLNFHVKSQYAVSHSEYQSPSLPQISHHAGKELKGGKWDRKTYKIVVSYDGSAFSGWQRQPGLYTVQGVLEQALGKFTDGKRAASLKSEGFIPEAAISVAGRTDKGVHAAGQVCSFYTWQSDIEKEEIRNVINTLEPKALRVVSLEEVCRTFHPNFSAKWRRYVYILPLHDAEVCESYRGQAFDDKESRKLAKPKLFSVAAVNGMLLQLEGQQLSYAVFARDTKASRSRGPATECMIYHARAAIAELPIMGPGFDGPRKVMCVELVGDRFLRKMVRVLVSTSIREAAAGSLPDCLVKLTKTSCRRASAPPAPPCGLCLTEVSYEAFSTASLLFNN